MEPVAIALICAAAFGVAVAIAVFVRHLLLSRDKRLNDLAQHNAIEQEANELEKLRTEMSNNKRFDAHYQVLGDNKDAIHYLDQKIEEIFKKKYELIHRYAEMALNESSAIIGGEQSAERKAICDRLKEEIDKEINFYDNEINQLQKRRASLWDAQTDLQEYLIDHETTRNNNLDEIYKHHTGLLEKVYLRHIENSETITGQTIDSSNESFKMIIMGPMQFLMQYFGLSTGISPEQAIVESRARTQVARFEDEINRAGDAEENYPKAASKNKARKSSPGRDQESSELTL